jgi:transcriptional regulator of acetoin/glycerol metabolism
VARYRLEGLVPGEGWGWRREAQFLPPGGGADLSGKVQSSSPAWIADIEKRAILAALESTHGNKTRAAALLGITRTKLHTRLKGFGITAESAV